MIIIVIDCATATFPFRSITRSYYRNSVGALVVFDVCNKKSLEHVPMWIMEAKRHIEPHKAVFILVGTKVCFCVFSGMCSFLCWKLHSFHGFWRLLKLLNYLRDVKQMWNASQYIVIEKSVNFYLTTRCFVPTDWYGRWKRSQNRGCIVSSEFLQHQICRNKLNERHQCRGSLQNHHTRGVWQGMLLLNWMSLFLH